MIGGTIEVVAILNSELIVFPGTQCVTEILEKLLTGGNGCISGVVLVSGWGRKAWFYCLSIPGHS